MTHSLSSTLAGGSDDYHGCDSCGDDTVQYVAYCLDCKDYLCNYCSISHRRISHFRHHQLLDKRRTPSPDQQLASDIVDDRSRRSLNAHNAVGTSSRPSQRAWWSYLTSRKLLIVSILVLLLAAWLAGSWMRNSRNNGEKATKLESGVTKTDEQRESFSDKDNQEEEHNGMQTEDSQSDSIASQHESEHNQDRYGGLDMEFDDYRDYDNDNDNDNLLL